MTNLFLIYLILLPLGSSFIMGWYLITRGYVGVQPDGSLKKYGKLLREWSFFWEGIDCYQKIYYTHDRLVQKVFELKRLLPKIQSKLSIDGSKMSVLVSSPLTPEEINSIEDVGLCRVFDKEDVICLYIEEPVYRFPAWVRFVLSSCPPCMSSFYGSLFWWVMWLVSENYFKFEVNMTGWAIIWPFYVVSLSVINYFVDKKI